MDDVAVLYDRAGSVATITLNRPDRLNAMNRALTEGRLGAVERAASDDGVRVVVLTGSGRAFSAGGDRFEDMADSLMNHGDDEADAAALRNVMRASGLLREMPKVTIAAINGPCAGAALALACAADLRFASTSAVFTTAFVSAALSGDFGGTWTLPRVVGDAKARELYLLAERIDAAEALRIGLISRVVEPAELAGVVEDVTRTLVATAPTALRLAKANLNDGAVLAFDDAMDREAARIVECLHSDDAAEARRAFREGRAPRYVAAGGGAGA